MITDAFKVLIGQLGVDSYNVEGEEISSPGSSELHDISKTRQFLILTNTIQVVLPVGLVHSCLIYHLLQSLGEGDSLFQDGAMVYCNEVLIYGKLC